jgi:hypothetical protein
MTDPAAGSLTDVEVATDAGRSSPAARGFDRTHPPRVEEGFLDGVSQFL